MVQHLAKQNRGFSPSRGGLTRRQRNISYRILELFSGRAPLQTQLIYIWVVFFELVAVSILAQLLYPGGFNILTHTISHQGSIEFNPVGSIIWRIGVVFNGFAHIPHIMFIGQQLKPINPERTKAVVTWGIISALGFVFVGIASMDIGIIHYIVALIAFIGYYITANITFSILKKGTYHGKDRLVKSSWFLYFKRYFIISGAATLLSFVINLIFFNKGLEPLLEWNYLLAICSWLILWSEIVRIIKKEQLVQILKAEILIR